MAKPQLTAPCLALVTDRRLCDNGVTLAEKVSQAVKGGVGIVQLREKDLPADELLALARDVKATIGGRALFIVNGSPEVALAVGADGVHLPEDGPTVTEVRRITGDDLLIGRSVHSLEAALRAGTDGADYLFVGTIFPSRSHPEGPATGVALLRDIGRQVAIPCFGIGGVDASNVGKVMDAGASGAAVISAILGAAEPELAVRELIEAMQTATTAKVGDKR
jgi:thiamine-phosphate diphosphorylase